MKKLNKDNEVFTPEELLKYLGIDGNEILTSEEIKLYLNFKDETNPLIIRVQSYLIAYYLRVLGYSTRNLEIPLDSNRNTICEEMNIGMNLFNELFPLMILIDKKIHENLSKKGYDKLRWKEYPEWYRNYIEGLIKKSIDKSEKQGKMGSCQPSTHL